MFCNIPFHQKAVIFNSMQKHIQCTADEIHAIKKKIQIKMKKHALIKFNSKIYQNLVTLESTGQWPWLNRSRTVTYVGMWCSICWQQSCGYMWWLWPRGWERQGGCWRRCEWPGSWTGTSWSYTHHPGLSKTSSESAMQFLHDSEAVLLQ